MCFMLYLVGLKTKVGCHSGINPFLFTFVRRFRERFVLHYDF